MNRRSFLQSATGAALALPWMESLGASATGIPQRLAIFYVPIGVVRSGFFPGEQENEAPKGNQGNRLDSLFPDKTTVGTRPLDKLTPTMQPLGEFKKDVTLITGMDRTFQNGTDVHAQCASCFLSSAKPFGVAQSAWPLKRTLDHIVGDHVGLNSPYKTLEFSANSHKDNKESIFFDNISWYGTGHLAPSMRDPVKAYKRLFGTSKLEATRKITDLVLADARSMQKELGYADREKFGEYFEGIRNIERQIDRIEGMRAELAKIDLKQPVGAHLPRSEYIRVMADIMVASLQSGLTNVTTFMVGPERWDTPFLYDGLYDDKPRSHHMMSHNQQNYADDLIKLDVFHMEMFVYVMEKMKAVRETDGTTLLDNTLLTYGSGLGDGSTHQYNDLPIIVAGGRKHYKHGQHIHMPEGTPLANLWQTQATLMGVKRDSFADSTGLIEPLLA